MPFEQDPVTGEAVPKIKKTPWLKHGNKPHQLTPEERLKGAKTKTLKKSIAQRLRRLKDKGLTSENEKHLVELLSNPDVANLDILIAIQKMNVPGMNNKDRRHYVNALMRWSETVHGKKSDAPNVAVQVNINNLPDAEIEARVKRILGDK